MSRWLGFVSDTVFETSDLVLYSWDDESPRAVDQDATVRDRLWSAMIFWGAGCRFFVAVAFLGVAGKGAGQEKGSIQ